MVNQGALRNQSSSKMCYLPISALSLKLLYPYLLYLYQLVLHLSLDYFDCLKLPRKLLICLLIPRLMSLLKLLRVFSLFVQKQDFDQIEALVDRTIIMKTESTVSLSMNLFFFYNLASWSKCLSPLRRLDLKSNQTIFSFMTFSF